jgi:hypothetical protein
VSDILQTFLEKMGLGQEEARIFSGTLSLMGVDSGMVSGEGSKKKTGRSQSIKNIIDWLNNLRAGITPGEDRPDFDLAFKALDEAIKLINRVERNNPVGVIDLWCLTDMVGRYNRMTSRPFPFKLWHLSENRMVFPIMKSPLSSSLHHFLVKSATPEFIMQCRKYVPNVE